MIVVVKEILTREIEVDTDNYEEALNQVKDKYNKEEIVLDSSDFKRVTFE